MAADGTVFYGSKPPVIPGIEYRSEFYALNGANGGKMQTRVMGWSGITEHRATGATAIGADGTVFIWSSTGGSLYALDGATLAEKWSRTFISDSYSWGSPAIGADGTMYVANLNLFALNADTGATKWEFELPGSPGAPGYITTAAAIGPDGTIYVGGGQFFYAINPDGTKKWEYRLPNVDGVIGAPAVAADGTVYFGSVGGILFAMNGETGAKKWDFTGSPFNSAYAPSIGADGTVYFASKNGPPFGGGILYAIEGTAPLANSPWPKYRQNLANTGLVGTDVPKVIESPKLVDGKLRIAWNGTHVLQRAPSPAGPWEDVLEVTSPFEIVPTSDSEFFRLRTR